MKKFKMSFEVTEDKLTTIISVLNANISNLAIEEVSLAKKAVGKISRGACVRTEAWMDKIKPVLLSAMDGEKPYSHKDPKLCQLMISNGYQPRTLSAVLSSMVRDGTIVRRFRGAYQKAN